MTDVCRLFPEWPARAAAAVERIAVAHRQKITGCIACLFVFAGASGCGSDGPSATGSPTGAVPPPSTSGPPSAPPPSPPPAQQPTDAIIFAAKDSQGFASQGHFIRTDGGATISYDAQDKQYSATITWWGTPALIRRDPQYVPGNGSPWIQFLMDGGGYFHIRASGEFSNEELRYFYSNLAAWGVPNGDDFSFAGHTAFGIATPENILPLSGSVTYTGFLEGSASERYDYGDWGQFYGGLKGKISLTFDFANDMATVSIVPILELTKEYKLPVVDRAPLVWSRRERSFHQAVPGNPRNLDYPVTGEFTGPLAEELIGGLHFDYVSPQDGSLQRVSGAFIAKRTP